MVHLLHHHPPVHLVRKPLHAHRAPAMPAPHVLLPRDFVLPLVSTRALKLQRNLVPIAVTQPVHLDRQKAFCCCTPVACLFW
jgi:hypothetical protein